MGPAATTMSDKERAQLTTIFKKVDADGGGTLDADELKEAFGDELASKLLGDLDANGDGELDLDEFVDGSLDKYGKDGTLAEMIQVPMRIPQQRRRLGPRCSADRPAVAGAPPGVMFPHIGGAG